MKKSNTTLFAFLHKQINFKTFALLLFCLFFGSEYIKAQEISWDGGGADDNWNTPANWSTDALPTVSSVVRIIGAGSDVIIPLGYQALAHFVGVANSATLTIDTGAELMVANSIGDGISLSFGAIIINNGVINVNDIAVNGMFIGRQSTFINSGHLNVGINMGASGIKMGGLSTIHNLAGGQINILGAGTGADGIGRFGPGSKTINNAGTICIEDANVDGDNIDPGIAYNETGDGELNTSGCAATGLVVEASIPTLSQWGLIVLALLLMTFGVLSLLPENRKEWEVVG